MAVASCKVNTAASWIHKNGLTVQDYTLHGEQRRLSSPPEASPQERRRRRRQCKASTQCIDQHAPYRTGICDKWTAGVPGSARHKICANWFGGVRSKYYCLFVAQGGAVAAQWRRSGGAVAAQWRRFTTGRAARRFSSARVAVAVAVRVTIRPHLPCQQSGSAAPVGKQQ